MPVVKPDVSLPELRGIAVGFVVDRHKDSAERGFVFDAECIPAGSRCDHTLDLEGDDDHAANLRPFQAEKLLSIR